MDNVKNVLVLTRTDIFSGLQVIPLPAMWILGPVLILFNRELLICPSFEFHHALFPGRALGTGVSLVTCVSHNLTHGVLACRTEVMSTPNETVNCFI